MEFHGMAAHAIAPLVVGELVARLCLAPEKGPVSRAEAQPSAVETNAPASRAKGSGAKDNKKAPKKSTKGDGQADRKCEAAAGRLDKVEGAPDEVHGRQFPALALVRARKVALLVKLGPT